MNYKFLIVFTMLIMLISMVKLEPFKNKCKKKKNICRGYLSDLEYLNHMIPHHQVAIDISLMLQKKTKSPEMHEILRKLIWTQNYEIDLMNVLINKKTKNITGGLSLKDYIPTVSDFTHPNVLGTTNLLCDVDNFSLSNTYCDPHFFDPIAHMKHMHHMNLDDEMYITHMIPHHQVAVDMSKVLLMNTSSDIMIYLAYRIIRSQNAEIIILNDFLEKTTYKHKSYLLN